MGITRFITLSAVLVGIVNAALTPPADVVGVPGDSSATVTWRPTDGGSATQYEISAQLQHPYPSTLYTEWYEMDDFSRTSFDSTRWDFTSSTCKYMSSGYNCWTQSPSVTQSGGTLNITSPGYSYFVYSWGTGADAANVHGRNGVGFLTPKATRTYGSSVFTNTTHNIMWTATIRDMISLSGSTYLYSNAGFVLYDFDSNNYPHWLMRYYLLWYNNQQYSYLYYDYAYHYSSPLGYGYRNQYWVASLPPNNFPMTLQMLRDGTGPYYYNRFYKFGYSWPADQTGAAFGNTGYTLYDSNIYFWPATPSAPNYANLRMALFAESTYIYNIQVRWEWYGMFPVLLSDLPNRAAWYTYWANRNNTILNYGICAVARDIRRVVTSDITKVTLKGLDMTSGYKISVAASDGTTKSAFNFTSGIVYPKIVLPGTLPNPLLYLDANALPSSAVAGISRWKDVTGQWEFQRTGSSTGPYLRAKTAKVPYNSVEFRNANSDMELLGSDVSTTWQHDAGYTNHEMSIFMVYQPKNAAYYGQNGAVIAKGGYFGYGESGFAVFAVSWYYTWTCASSCMYVYGFSYGAHIKNGDYDGAGIYGSYAEGAYGTAGAHPHSASPTLVTYNYRKINSAGTYGTYQMDACQGIITGNGDQCSSTAVGSYPTGIGAVNGATQQWSPGVRREYYPQYVTGNNYQYSSPWTVNNKQNVRLGALGWTYSWWSYSYFYLTDIMTGDLHALMLYKGNPLTSTQIQDAQAFLADRYFLRCPAVPAAPNASSGCPMGNVGALCTLSCASGFTRAGGSTALRCSAGFYVGKNIYCAAPCPSIASPPDYASCSKYFVYDEFVPNANFQQMMMYDVAPALPAIQAADYWSVDSTGRLIGTAPTVDDPCSQVSPSGLFVNQPSWLSGVSLTDPLTTEVDVTVDSGAQAGLIYRVLSNQTYYRFTIVGDGMSVMEKIIGNSVVRTRWVNASYYPIASGKWYRLSVYVKLRSQTELINDIIARINGTVVWNVSDSDIPTGSGGMSIYSGRAKFDNFGIYGACDSNGDACLNLVSGMECQYSCRPGFYVSGDYRQKCGNSGKIISNTVECVPYPPTLLPQTFNISEAAPINTVAGIVNVTAAGPGQIILFTLLPQNNNETMRDRFGVVKGTASEVFRVGTCSGELLLNVAGVLDYYTNSRVFKLKVRACANGRNDSCTDGDITVNVLRAPRPPVFEADPVSGSLTTWLRSVPENSPVGTTILPAIAAYTPEPNPILYSITFGNNDFTYGIQNTTGVLFVNRSIINYEVQSLYTILVTARDSVYTNLSNSIVVNVNVTDRNDAPVAAVVQEIQVIENALGTLNVLVGKVIATDEDAGDSITYTFTSGSNANFTIDSQTGGLRVAQTKVYNQEIDPVIIVNGLQTRDTLKFFVNATDTKGASVCTQVIVYIIANLTATGQPIFDSVELPSGGLRTIGGDTIVIRGQNLDTIYKIATAKSLYVYYSSQVQDPWTRNYTAINCTVANADTATCIAPPGFGSGLAVTARWGITRKQVLTSTVLLVNYKNPTVTSICGNCYTAGGDAKNVPTAGGLVLKLTGANFGPEYLQTPASQREPWPIEVRYGNSFEYRAFPFYVAGSYDAHNTLYFSAVEGVGNDLPIKVTVGGLASQINNSTATITYGKPLIFSITVPSGATYTPSNFSTGGNEDFVINGQNFGPDTYAAVARYSVNKTVLIANVPTFVQFSYIANCRKPTGITAHTIINCKTVPGVGSGLLFTVIAAGQTSPRDGNITISYGAPVLQFIKGAGARLADTAGGQQVNLQGDNLGTLSIGDGSPNTVTMVPITATYGRTGSEYIAVDCKVTSNIPNVISCLTAPGTGTNHSWRLIVGGQDGGVFSKAKTGYAPPVISTFSRSYADTLAGKETKKYATTGQEVVIITGKNFGPAIISGKFSALYRTQLRDPLTDAPVWDAPNTTDHLGDERGVLTYIPSTNCTMTTPHKVLSCVTERGAGADLQWVITVDEQISTFPATGYDRPRIKLITASDGSSPVTAATTDGGTIMYVKGVNFGPRLNCRGPGNSDPCFGYVQSVRYGLNGVEQLARDFTVIDHETIKITLGPGFGQNLRMTVTVADQESEASDDVFSYGVPTILSVTPTVADTDPTPQAPTTITIVGRDFSLLDSQAQVSVIFGNAEDSSQSPFLPLQSMVPTWTDPVGAAQHTPGSSHTVTFLLPQGLSADRAIRVVVYERGKPTGYRVVSAAILGTSSFSYTAPSISAVIVQTPDAIRANGTIVADFVRSNFDLVATPNVYALTILGKNFGPAKSQTNDAIKRLVEGRPNNLNPWTNWGVIFSWSHEKIIVFTSESTGTVRINAVGKSFVTGLDVPHISNDYDYYDMSPSIGNLVGTPGPFDTRGGAVIGFTIKHLSSMVNNLTAFVGSRSCPILTLEGTEVYIPTMRTTMVLNSSYYVTPNAPPGTINADTVWTLYCRIPEGEGISNPLIIRRDNDGSNTDVMIAYYPPSISSYSIQQEDGSWVSSNYVFGASTMVVPNDGTRIRISGLNFGICPSIYMAEGPQLYLGQSICSNRDNSTIANHTYLEFTSVKGDGKGFTFFINVGGQDTAIQYPIVFNYYPPTVSYFSPEGRTAGGDVIRIQGKNLGVYRIPIVNIGSQPCTGVISYNSTFATCILAEGSGSGKSIDVTVNTQVWSAAAAFHYSLPTISTVTINNTAYTAEANGATPGGYLVDVQGDNFGIADYTKHCLFVAWRNRDRLAPLTCNARMDYLGEGEIPIIAIDTWNHTFIRFIMPPGIGGYDIIPFVASQIPAVPFIFRYSAPNITAQLSPNHGGTNGGDLITITGINFGAAAVDTSNANVAANLFPAYLPVDLDTYLKAARPPTAVMAINFFRSCISSALDAKGYIPPVTATCYQGGVITHAHNSIRFLSAGGIGVNRSVSVTIYDEEPDVANPLQKKVISVTSNIVKFHYDPPKVTASADNPVLQVGGGVTNIVTLSGINFGSLVLQQQQQWTAEEKLVEVFVNGQPTVSVERVSRYNQDTLEVVLPDLPVGRKNVSYTVAGQTGYTPDTSFAAIFTACLGGRKDYHTYDAGPWTGSFGRYGEFCAECPLGSVCAGFDPDLIVPGTQSEIDGGTHTYPVPVIGWYNLNSTDRKTTGMYDICPEEIMNRYPGRDVCIVPCEPPEACLGANICSDPYKSVAPYFRCATCNDGFYKRANECVKCPDSPWALVIGFTMLVMFGGALAYFLNKRKINLAFIAIGVDYFQVIAIFAQSKVAWPPILKELFHVLSAFNLNIEIVAPECIVPNLAFKQKWSFIMALPIAITFFFALVTGVTASYKAFIKGQRVKFLNQGAALASSVLLLMYVMYIYLTRNVLDIFNCTPTDPPDGKYYLTAVFEECYKPGSSQQVLLPAGIIAALVYVAGYPSALLYLLYKNREAVMEDQLLRAKGVGSDRLTNPHCYQLRKRWSRTYYQFKPDLYFWTFIIIVRKFCIAATYILFNKNPSFQLAAAMLIMFLAYAAQVVYYPYMSPADCEDVLKQHERLSFSSPVHARLRATISGIESRGRKIVRRNLLNNEGKVDSKAILGVLRNWLFNYNTVEEIMLFSAVIVALMGIMYASNTSTNAVKNAYYASARDAVTAVVLIVIIASIIYFAVVVITEISIMSAEAQRRRVAARAAQIAKSKGSDPSSPNKTSFSKSPRNESFNVGDIQGSTNPMFLNQERAKTEKQLQSGEMTAADAIRAMREPPPNELWYVYQRTYAELIERVNEMKNQYNSYGPEVKRMTEAAFRGESVNAADYVDEEELYRNLANSRSMRGASPSMKGASSPDSRENKRLIDSPVKKSSFKPTATIGSDDIPKKG